MREFSISKSNISECSLISARRHNNSIFSGREWKRSRLLQLFISLRTQLSKSYRHYSLNCMIVGMSGCKAKAVSETQQIVMKVVCQFSLKYAKQHALGKRIFPSLEICMTSLWMILWYPWYWKRNYDILSYCYYNANDLFDQYVCMERNI